MDKVDNFVDYSKTGAVVVDNNVDSVDCYPQRKVKKSQKPVNINKILFLGYIKQ